MKNGGKREELVKHRNQSSDLSGRRAKTKDGFVSNSPGQELGRQISLARVAAGMTQRQLASAIRTKQGNVSRMELGGNNFTVEMLQRVAKALKVNLKIEFCLDPKAA